MYENKKVLLIAGGGTLGTYTAEELLRLGCTVDVICLEENVSWHERLRYIQAKVDKAFLEDFLPGKGYDGIVNFIHYPDVEEYKQVHPILAANTGHLIFLSSYRIYADEQHPITESAPKLLDVSTDEKFLAEEDYALSKAKAERYLREESGTHNWTAVRPVISFSQRRFDLICRSGRDIIEAAKKGEVLELMADSRNLTAGLDWAGNSGKLIANLLFKEGTFGESYTISSGQNLTWGQVAQCYEELLGAKFAWIDTQTYMEKHMHPSAIWLLLYDRLFDRYIDNSKVLKATGLENYRFPSIKEGIQIELDKIGEEYRK